MSLLVPLGIAGCAWRAPRQVAQESVVNCRHLAQQGLTALEQGDLGEAERFLAQATKTCPVDADARQSYADVLWKAGRREEALAQAERAVLLDDESAPAYVLLAKMRLEQGQADLAAKAIEQAIDLDPSHAEAWSTRGQILQSTAQLRPALAAYNRALGLDPEHVDTLVRAAELQLSLQQPERALGHLQQARALSQAGEASPRIDYLLGLTCISLERYRDAAAHLATADRKAPGSAEVLARLADAHLALGQVDLAAATAQRALALQPDFAAGRAVLERVAMARRSPTGTLRR